MPICQSVIWPNRCFWSSSNRCCTLSEYAAGLAPRIHRRSCRLCLWGACQSVRWCHWNSANPLLLCTRLSSSLSLSPTLPLFPGSLTDQQLSPNGCSVPEPGWALYTNTLRIHTQHTFSTVVAADGGNSPNHQADGQHQSIFASYSIAMLRLAISFHLPPISHHHNCPPFTSTLPSCSWDVCFAKHSSFLPFSCVMQFLLAHFFNWTVHAFFSELTSYS